MNRAELVGLAKQHESVFLPGFVQWIFSNYPIFVKFSELADAVWERKRRGYSSRTIVEKMRFDHDVYSNDDSGFKIANARSPDLGRLYILVHPHRLDLFTYVRGDFPEYVKEFVI